MTSPTCHSRRLLLLELRLTPGTAPIASLSSVSLLLLQLSRLPQNLLPRLIKPLLSCLSCRCQLLLLQNLLPSDNQHMIAQIHESNLRMERYSTWPLFRQILLPAAPIRTYRPPYKSLSSVMGMTDSRMTFWSNFSIINKILTSSPMQIRRKLYLVTSRLRVLSSALKCFSICPPRSRRSLKSIQSLKKMALPPCGSASCKSSPPLTMK